MKDSKILRPKNVPKGHSQWTAHVVHRHKANRKSNRATRNREAIQEG